jgi:hypothetical protein
MEGGSLQRLYAKIIQAGRRRRDDAHGGAWDVRWGRWVALFIVLSILVTQSTQRAQDFETSSLLFCGGTWFLRAAADRLSVKEACLDLFDPRLASGEGWAAWIGSGERIGISEEHL